MSTTVDQAWAKPSQNGPIAYLITQYPKVSHSFIRREIAALERLGLTIQRFSIRSCAQELTDAKDLAELGKTRVVLGQATAAMDLLRAVVQVVVQRPQRFLAALGLACALGLRGEKNLLYHLIYLAEACLLLVWFSAEGIRHVHVHFGVNSTTVALLCRRLGGPPYSFTVHGPDEFDKPEAISLAAKIRAAQFVVAISSFGASQLYRWADAADWSKIHIVHCGLDQAFLTQPTVPIDDAPHLVCVGRLSQQKGHLLLLQAVEQLVAEGYQLTLSLVGDGEMRPQIEQVIADRRLHRYVSLEGWASEEGVKAHLQRSRALVLPSFAEGLPVVIMEAMALGRPVIASALAGIPELVEHNVHGWLVVPGSLASLVEAMRTALEASPAAIAAIGRAGMEKVGQRHSIEAEARKLAKLLGYGGAAGATTVVLPQPMADLEAGLGTGVG